MKKTLIKLFILVLVAILTFGLVACETNGGDTEETEQAEETTAVEKETDTTTVDEETEEPKTVEWMLVEYSTIDYTEQNLVYDLFEKAGNIILEIRPVPLDVYTEKFNVTLAGNNVPDIIEVYGTAAVSAVNELGPEGIFVSISDNYDLMPNLKQWIDKYEDSVKGILATDGELYIIPKVMDYTPAYEGIALRTDILENAGFDVDSIETTDDLYTAFETLRDANDGNPVLGARGGTWNLNFLANVFGTQLDSYTYDSTQEEYVCPIYTENCKGYVEYLNNMINDGLLSRDWSSMSDSQWMELSKAGTLTAFTDNMQNINDFQRAFDELGNTDWHFEGIMTPTYNGVFYPWGGSSHLEASWNPAVSAESDAIEEILTAWDWGYDPENQVILSYGYEGENYTVRDDGSYEVTSTTYTNEEGETLEACVGWNENYLQYWTEAEFFQWSLTGGVETSGFETASRLYGKNVYTYTLPQISINDEENDRLKEIKTSIDTFIKENVTHFINGTRDLDEWDDFVEEVKAMGVDEVVDIYNQALARLGD